MHADFMHGTSEGHAQSLCYAVHVRLQVPTPKDVERMPYLRAVIDEALRLLALKKDMKQSPLGKNL